MKITRTKSKNPLARAFAEPLDLDQEIVYRRLTVVEELLQFMKREGINRSELAQRMGVGPSRITKMLSGDENLTIDTLVRAGQAVGADLAQTFVPHGKRGHWVATTARSTRQENAITVDFDSNQVNRAPAPALSSKQPAPRDAEDAA